MNGNFFRNGISKHLHVALTHTLDSPTDWMNQCSALFDMINCLSNINQHMFYIMNWDAASERMAECAVCCRLSQTHSALLFVSFALFMQNVKKFPIKLRCNFQKQQKPFFFFLLLFHVSKSFEMYVIRNYLWVCLVAKNSTQQLNRVESSEIPFSSIKAFPPSFTLICACWIRCEIALNRFTKWFCIECDYNLERTFSKLNTDSGALRK